MTCPKRECPQPELCAYLKQHLHGRAFEIWRGVNIAPERAALYRQRWCEMVGVDRMQAEAMFPPDVASRVAEPLDSLNCIDRGPETRRATCRPCGNGGAVQLPVFECSVFGEAVIRGAVFDSTPPHVCLTCKVRDPGRHVLAKHVTRFAVGVTSAPRTIPTVSRCVESIKAAGFENVTIYAEPNTNGLPPGVPVVLRPEVLGCWRNYVQTMRDLLASNPDAQAIVIFQDDITAARDSRRWIEHDLWPSDRCGVVSLYAPDYPGYEERGHIGLKLVTGTHLMGACAMVYPRKSAEAIVAHPLADDWQGAVGRVEPDPRKKKAADLWVGTVLLKLGLRSYFYDPSLCQHVAETSAIGHGGREQLRNGRKYRRSLKFAGEDVSAFRVFAKAMPTVRYNSDGALRLRDPLAVVVPAWNCFDLTERCLTALAKNGGIDPLEVIYVDNGSEPGTVERVEELARGLGLFLRSIRFETNRGFCPAANAGMRAAEGRHVLLLNNDCYVHRGCLPAMVRHLLSDPYAGTVGPLTADNGSQSVARHASLAKIRGQRKSLRRNMVAGFCQLKRAETLAAIGLLDDSLAHGLGTDDDWCHRARKAGWRVLLALDAFADHDHSQTFKRSGQDRRGMQRDAISYLRAKGVL